MKHICVSYFPSYLKYATYTSIDELRNVDKIVESLRASTDIAPVGILWQASAVSSFPSLVFDGDAEAVYEHLMHWCSGNPHDWFSWDIINNETSVAFGVMPNIELSLNRYKETHGIGVENNQNLDVQLMFRQLNVVCPISTYSKLDKPIAETTDIGFSNIEDARNGRTPRLYIRNIRRSSGMSGDFCRHILERSLND